MIRIAKLALLSAVTLGSGAAAVLADQAPRYDVTRTCRAESQPTESKKNTEACLADEQSAREQLNKEWEQFAADSRATCSALGNDPGSVQSYIELLSCLQASKQAKELTR